MPRRRKPYSNPGAVRYRVGKSWKDGLGRWVAAPTGPYLDRAERWREPGRPGWISAEQARDNRPTISRAMGELRNLLRDATGDEWTKIRVSKESRAFGTYSGWTLQSEGERISPALLAEVLRDWKNSANFAAVSDAQRTVIAAELGRRSGVEIGWKSIAIRDYGSFVVDDAIGTMEDWAERYAKQDDPLGIEGITIDFEDEN